MVERTIKIRTTFDGAAANRGMSNLEKQAKKSAAAMEQLGMRVGRSMMNIGRNLTMYVTLPIIGLGVASLKVGADFETGMNRVRAVTGATGDEFVALREQAEDLGATTQFTAKQAADAMGFLAMAGFEANEVMGAMPSTLQLAAAGQMDLAQAADIASNILTGYRMETDQLVHANDVLVNTFISTNTNLSQLGEAMKYVAPIAAGAGLQFEETAAALGMLGNAGIQGSMAGTTLRGTLSALLNPTKQEADALADLGVSTVNSAGELLSLADIIEQLESSGASAAQVLEIFGDRAGPGMKSLIDQGSQALRDLTAEHIVLQGTAEEIANVQMEGLNGALLKLKSAFEGMLIAIGDSGLLDQAVELAGRITEWISGFKELSPAMQKAIVGFAALAAATGPVLMGLGQMTIGFVTLKQSMGMLNVAGVTARLATLRVALFALGTATLAWAGAIGILIAAIVILKAHQDELNRSIAEATEPIHSEITAMRNQRVEILKLAGEIRGLTNINDDSTESFEGMRDKVIELAKEYPEYIRQLGITIDETGDLYDINGDLIDSTITLDGILNSFDTSSFVSELSKAITEARLLEEAIIDAVRARDSWTSRAARAVRGAFGEEPIEQVIIEERGPEGVTYTPAEITQEQLKQAELATSILDNVLDIVEDTAAIIKDEGDDDDDDDERRRGGGRRREPEEETEAESRAKKRVEEWDRVENQILEAQRRYATQLEHLTELEITEEQATSQFRSGIRSAVESMLLLNEESELTAGHLEFMNLWLKYLGDTIVEVVEEIADPVGDVIDKYRELITQLDIEMEVARNLGVYEEEHVQFLQRMIDTVRDVITELENFKRLGLLTPEDQNRLTGLYNLFGMLIGLMETLLPDVDAVSTDEGDKESKRLHKILEGLNENFLVDLAAVFSRLIQNLLKGGDFDAAGAATSLFSPVASMWAGDVVKQWGLGAGFIDPISGIIAGLAGFAFGRIFGGDKPLEIEQPLEMVLVDVSANLRNIFNWQGMDPMTYSSRFRGVFESGLYG